jgi:ParB family transcriptional regulator, chromosome partitioning protein
MRPTTSRKPPTTRRPGPSWGWRIDATPPALPAIPDSQSKTQRLFGMPAPDEGEVVSPEGFIWVPAAKCIPDPAQPRQYFDPEQMDLLRASIESEGQQEPAWVEKLEIDGNIVYKIVDGERRWRSVSRLGWSHLKIIFKRPVSAGDRLKMQTVANFGKAEHPPLEIARTLDRLRKLPEYRELSETRQHEEMSKLFCKSHYWVTYHLSLLKLHPKVQAMMEPTVPEERRLKVVMGAFLSTVNDHAEQIHIAQYAIDKAISVKEAREYARQRAEKQGFSIGARPEKPSDGYRKLRKFVSNLKRESGLVRSTPRTRFMTTLQSRTPEDRLRLARELSACIEDLNYILDAIRLIDKEGEVK